MVQNVRLSFIGFPQSRVNEVYFMIGVGQNTWTKCEKLKSKYKLSNWEKHLTYTILGAPVSVRQYQRFLPSRSWLSKTEKI